MCHANPVLIIKMFLSTIQSSRKFQPFGLDTKGNGQDWIQSEWKIWKKYIEVVLSYWKNEWGPNRKANIYTVAEDLMDWEKIEK